MRADSRRLPFLASGTVGAIFTSPPYWVRGWRMPSVDAYARRLAVDFGREWRRVLVPGGDLWLVIGDRHDGREWVGVDAALTRWLRRTGWRLQSRGWWAQIGSRERWDNRVNHLLRFRRAGRIVRPGPETLAWLLPLPRSPGSLWDATPEPLIRVALQASPRRKLLLDPFAGAGTTGRVARALGWRWVGVESDPRMAALAARRLGLSSRSGSMARPRRGRGGSSPP